MTDGDIEIYSYLWNMKESEWVLVKVQGASLPVIYNPVDRHALIIENDDHLVRVIDAMKASGIPVLEKFPDHRGGER
ncbi:MULTISPECIES: hypothetical protein [unclassified Streptomyces]|uniref:hypothetical protein n=1 Tax=unclassified Streptomyces TaxID=2593676 RepID=UPI0011A67BA1|nr:hypothetical protein [Streptomyces sp. BK340]TVZ95333.1 hypothetical protein FB157_104442 [Streptomyces sp. BK340]